MFEPVFNSLEIVSDRKVMLSIGEYIFSPDIIEKKFKCDLPLCLGNCCRYGDSGAPLEDEEIGILDEIWEDVRPFLRPEGIKTIEKSGTSIIDFDNDRVTPLIGTEECAYTVLSGNIFMCGIEKAWSEGKISFRKPISCHLFPIRIKRFKDFVAVNYQELSICHSALARGMRENVYVYEFLKDPLIRLMGEESYNELCLSAEEFRRTRRQSGY